jgi:cell division protein FtsB
MEKVKVKGSPQYHLKVVAHRPVRAFLISSLLIVLTVASVLGAYFFAQYRTTQQMLTPEQAEQLRAESQALRTQVEALQQELTKYQVTTEVDRQASNDIRGQVLSQREKIDALKRDIAVYRMMTSKNNNNPMGISFGVFSVERLVETGVPSSRFQLQLTVQKLAESDRDFVGKLQFVVVGQRAGQEEKIPLHQLAQGAEGSEPLMEEIPLSFKLFQRIEASFHLPEGFSPVRVELKIFADGKKSAPIESQLAWPEVK